MDRVELERFLQRAGKRTLAEYVGATEGQVADSLRRRLAWARTATRDPKRSEEARWLLTNADALRREAEAADLPPQPAADPFDVPAPRRNRWVFDEDNDAAVNITRLTDLTDGQDYAALGGDGMDESDWDPSFTASHFRLDRHLDPTAGATRTATPSPTSQRQAVSRTPAAAPQAAPRHQPPPTPKPATPRPSPVVAPPAAKGRSRPPDRAVKSVAVGPPADEESVFGLDIEIREGPTPRRGAGPAAPAETPQPPPQPKVAPGTQRSGRSTAMTILPPDSPDPAPPRKASGRSGAAGPAQDAFVAVPSVSASDAGRPPPPPSMPPPNATPPPISRVVSVIPAPVASAPPEAGFFKRPTPQFKRSAPTAELPTATATPLEPIAPTLPVPVTADSLTVPAAPIAIGVPAAGVPGAVGAPRPTTGPVNRTRLLSLGVVLAVAFFAWVNWATVGPVLGLAPTTPGPNVVPAAVPAGSAPTEAPPTVAVPPIAPEPAEGDAAPDPASEGLPPAAPTEGIPAPAPSGPVDASFAAPDVPVAVPAPVLGAPVPPKPAPKPAPSTARQPRPEPPVSVAPVPAPAAAPVVAAPVVAPVALVQPTPAPTEILLPPPNAGAGGLDSRCLPDHMASRAQGGTLTDVQRQCMDRSVSTAAAGPDRTRLSSLLLLDATARQDTAAWQRLARRHLEQIEPGNGSLAFKYAGSMFQSGALADASKWCDAAITNKGGGATGRSGTNNAYKLRVAIAEKKIANGEANNSELLRVGQDWFAWARANNLDVTGAAAACAAAGGSCE